jgi:hypothetical protein
VTRRRRRATARSPGLALLLVGLSACGSSDGSAGSEGGRGGAAGGGAAGDHGGTAAGGVPAGGAGAAAGTGGAGGGSPASSGGTTSTDAGSTGGSGGSPQRVVCEGSYDIGGVEEFDAFVALGCQVVTGSLRIANTELASIAGLVVEEIGEDLYVVANAELASLAGLERVRLVGRNLNIVNDGSLSSLEPLPSWPADAVGGDLSIFQNPLLPQCAVDAFDAYLTASCQTCSGNGTGTCP